MTRIVFLILALVLFLSFLVMAWLLPRRIGPARTVGWERDFSVGRSLRGTASRLDLGTAYSFTEPKIDRSEDPKLDE